MSPVYSVLAWWCFIIGARESTEYTMLINVRRGGENNPPNKFTIPDASNQVTSSLIISCTDYGEWKITLHRPLNLFWVEAISHETAQEVEKRGHNHCACAILCLPPPTHMMFTSCDIHSAGNSAGRCTSRPSLLCLSLCCFSSFMSKNLFLLVSWPCRGNDNPWHDQNCMCTKSSLCLQGRCEFLSKTDRAG